ncbi:hypothetical protein BC834DRAFT_802695, partial [Gloeopeniophorella convolvens]
MSDAPPPPYSERPEALNSSPPNPEQPVASSSRSSNTSPMFHVGLRAIHAPLVEIRHLRLHLSLLYALQGLRTRVESANEPSWPPLASSLGGEQRWTWFVNLAVERFQRWLEKLSPPSRSNTLAKFVRNDMPPIDVWMVLHAYLLNPQSFAEDCSRIRSLGSLTALVSAVPDLFLEAFNTISDVILWKPHAASRANWVAKTGLPFDPLECAAILLHQDIACPQCKAVAAYLTPSGTGYAEPNFSYTCTSCSFDITREKLAISKLTTDLTAHLLHESQTGSADMQLYLPCTLRTEYGDDTIRATGIKQDLLNLKPISQFNSRKWKQNQGASLAMAESLEWKFSEIKKAWSQLQKPKIAAKILGAYYNQRPFSVELIGAVLRQGSFITKMHDLGWTAPTYFEKHEDALALHHAVMRYHAFLDLMSSSQHALVVPTLDIDLVWHTHQLAGSRYQKDCKTNVGRYIDHDDKVEQFYLSNAFDATCRAWEKRYGLPYTQCGCPLPGNTIGQKLARLVSHVGSRHYPLSRLAPPANQPEALAASHPSDHPAVAVLGLASNAAAKAQRESKAARRREREATRARRGEISPEEFERGAAHAPAFLVPVPL